MNWPSLPYEKWKESLDTLHLWMQVVGKVKLKLNPFLNQWWEVAFYVTPVGMTTGRIHYKHIAFSVDFDFITHTLYIQTSSGKRKKLKLKPMSVADFYQDFMQNLKNLNIDVRITPTPSEIKESIPFKIDTKHASYDKEYITKWWQIQLQTSLVLDRFRVSFRGKSSPVHFFWGSFDITTTRFSGTILPDKTDWPKGYSFMRYAENEENFTCGFWPGDERFTYPAFYSYIYPAPKGSESINTGPAFSYFNKKLSLCILPYEEVIKTENPEKEILNFLETTYKENAKLAGWDTKKFENPSPLLKKVLPKK